MSEPIGPVHAAFDDVVRLIQGARLRAADAVNVEVIDLYWRIGEYLHHRIEADGWAKGTVVQLASYIATREPGRRGFSPQNLWRMRQFKDAYLLEFLDLPVQHSEADLHRGLLQHLGRFLTELGCDFCCIDSQYPVQVGGQDFALYVLFFHRGLNCLFAIELKVTAFAPEHLGKLNFYLEALDRDVRKPHENPAIGLLLCASKDDEVVEYALSRTLSPAMVAQYQTQLPDKRMLAAKLHEPYALSAPEELKRPAIRRQKNKGGGA